MAVKFSNNAATLLAANATNSDTTLTVSDGSVFPSLSGSDHTYVTLEDVNANREIVKVTAISGNSLTVVRAQDGTTARAFSTADKCELRVIAALLNDLSTQGDTESVSISGDTMTGNLSLGDNVKAQFGASNDLQIYHDGSNSYIDEQGTGSLNIRSSTTLRLQNASGTNYLYGTNAGEVVLYHNGAPKLYTTSTGIDVTGSVVADGLSVSNSTALIDITANTINTQDRGITLSYAGSYYGKFSTNVQTGKTLFESGRTGTAGYYFDFKTDGNLRQKIASNGDISFYNDSAAQGLFWDSSTSRLGLGTTLPLSALNVKGTQGQWRVDPDSVSNHVEILSTNTANTGFLNLRLRTNDFIVQTGGTDRLTLNSSGNATFSGSITANQNFTFANNNTDNTNKEGHLLARQYDSGTETEGFQVLQYFANSSLNRIDIGGASSQYNAATQITFNTAANTTTRTGTQALTLDSSQNATFSGAVLDVENSSGAMVMVDDTNGRFIKIRSANSGSQNANISSYSGLHLGGSDNASHMLISNTGNVSIGSSLMVGSTTAPSYKTHIKNTASWSLAYNNYSNDLFLENTSSGAGVGNFGGSIGFSGAGTETTNKRVVIASVQTGSDQDQCGLAFFTHPSQYGSENIEEALRISHDKSASFSGSVTSAGLTSSGDAVFQGNVTHNNNNASSKYFKLNVASSGDGHLLLQRNNTNYWQIHSDGSNVLKFDGYNGASSAVFSGSVTTSGSINNIQSTTGTGSSAVKNLIYNDGGGDSALQLSILGSIDYYLGVDNTDDSFKIGRASWDSSPYLSINSSGNATFSGAVTANAGVVVDNITIDGNEIDVSSGDLTLDVAGKINLDHGSPEILLKDGGTHYASFISSNTDFVIQSILSDKDMLFKGQDGSSTITALTLDMSQAGRATFNEGIVAKTSTAGDFGLTLNTISGDSMKLSVTDTGTGGGADGIMSVSDGDLTLDVAGLIGLDAGNQGAVQFKNDGTVYGTVFKSGSSLFLESNISDGDISFRGSDSGSNITALTLDMSDGGAAHFTNDIYIKDNQAIRFGDDQDFRIFNDSNHTTFQNSFSNQDMLFKGNDDGSFITALTLDMSQAGAATFNSSVAANKLTILATDGVRPNDYVASFQNQEATNSQSFGVSIAAGSTGSDIALNVVDHDASNVLLRVFGNGATTIGGAATFNAGATFSGNITMQNDDALLFIKETDGTNIAAVGDLTGAGQGGAFYYNHGGTATIQLKSYEASTIGHGLNVGGSVTSSGTFLKTGTNGNYTIAANGNDFYYGRNGTNYHIANTANGGFQFLTGSSSAEALRITSAQNINIANGGLMVGSTTAPNQPLEVNGNIGFSKGTNAGRYLLVEGADATWAGDVNIQAGFGSSGAGGGVKLYGHAHSTYAGSVWIGRSGGSAGNIMFGNGGTGPTSASQIQMVIDSSGRVGIKTTPSAWTTDYAVLDLNTGGSIYGTTSGVTTASNLYFNGSSWLAKNTGLGTLYAQHSGSHNWYSSASVSAGSAAGLSTKMTLTSGGDLLVGKTSANFTVAGHEIKPNSFAGFTRDGGCPVIVNRLTNSGDLMEFYQGLSSIGKIGTANGDLHIDGDTGIRFQNTSIIPRRAGSDVDATVDIGLASHRWKDLYLSGTANTANVTSSGQIKVTGSNASTVAFSVGDAGTGWYNTGSNSIGLATAGSEKLRIASSGSVSIGTIDSHRKLTVSGQGSASCDILIHNDTDTDNSFNGLMFKADSQNNNTRIKGAVFFERTGTRGTGTLHLCNDGGNDDSNVGLADSKLSIASSGSVGIGNAIASSFNSGANNLVIGSGSGSEGMTIYGGGESNIFFADGTAGSAAYVGRIEYSHSVDKMLFYVNNSQAMTIDSSGSVGIGVVPSASHYKSLEIGNSGSSITGRGAADTHFMSGLFWDAASTYKYSVSSVAVGSYQITNGIHYWATAPAGTAGNTATPQTNMMLTAGGDLLVGKTAASFGTAGVAVFGSGEIDITNTNEAPLFLNRLGSDGVIQYFYKDGTNVGRIGTSGDELYIGKGDTTLLFNESSDAVLPRGTNGAQRDGAVQLGSPSNRFSDLYLSGGVQLGGTGSANKLDDYEEGTWTPALEGSGGTSGTAYTVQQGRYTKIGNTVTATFHILLSNEGTLTGTTRIGGLPYSGSGSPNYQTATLMSGNMNIDKDQQLMGMQYAVNAFIYLMIQESDLALSQATGNGPFKNNTEISGTVTYFTNA